MDTNRLTQISSVVDDVQNELKDYNDKSYFRFLRFVERGLKELNIFHLNNVSVMTLTVDTDSKSAPLPGDFLTLRRIGVLLGNGRVYPLTADSDLNINKDSECGQIQKDDSTAIVQDYRTYKSRGGTSEAGTYRINYKQNRIEFGPSVTSDTVIIEYVSSGIQINGDTFVPELAREALMSFVMWKIQPIGTALRQRAEIAYYTEIKKLNDAMMPTMDEMVDALLQGKTQIKY